MPFFYPSTSCVPCCRMSNQHLSKSMTVVEYGQVGNRVKQVYTLVMYRVVREAIIVITLYQWYIQHGARETGIVQTA